MNDPLGRALHDYHTTGKSDRLKVHSDIATADEIPVPYLFRSWDDMPEIEQRALNLCSGKVLDIGAGAGSHTLWLQERGFDVTAIDTSEGAVKIMQERGVVDVIQEDIYQHTGKYDTLLLLMNGIGIAGDIDGLKKLLLHLKSLLNEGGQIIFDSSDIKYMFEEDDGSMWVDLNSDYYGVVEYQFEYKGEKSEIFDWLFIDFSSFKEIATQVGLSTTLMYEDDSSYLATSS